MENKVITVNCSASEKRPADFVCVHVSASGEDKKYAVAAEKAESAAKLAVQKLKACGIDDVKLTGITVRPIRDGKKITGYNATRALTAQFDYGARILGECADALSSLECEWRVSFMLKNPDTSALLASAVELGKKKAQAIANAAGVKLGKLVSARYGDDGAAMLCMGRNGDGLPEPEEIKLTETVVCDWEIS